MNYELRITRNLSLQLRMSSSAANYFKSNLLSVKNTFFVSYRQIKVENLLFQRKTMAFQRNNYGI